MQNTGINHHFLVCGLRWLVIGRFFLFFQFCLQDPLSQAWPILIHPLSGFAFVTFSSDLRTHWNHVSRYSGGSCRFCRPSRPALPACLQFLFMYAHVNRLWVSVVLGTLVGEHLGEGFLCCLFKASDKGRRSARLGLRECRSRG